MIRRLASHAVLTVLALAACGPAPAPPPPTVSIPAASASAPPPAIVDAPATTDAGAGGSRAPVDGFVVRNADGTCERLPRMYCCPPGALCKPTPPPERVPCPPLGADVGGSQADPDAYVERRTDGRCYTGATPARVRRTPCCDERWPSK